MDCLELQNIVNLSAKTCSLCIMPDEVIRLSTTQNANIPSFVIDRHTLFDSLLQNDNK